MILKGEDPELEVDQGVVAEALAEPAAWGDAMDDIVEEPPPMPAAPVVGKWAKIGPPTESYMLDWMGLVLSGLARKAMAPCKLLTRPRIRSNSSRRPVVIEVMLSALHDLPRI